VSAGGSAHSAQQGHRAGSQGTGTSGGTAHLDVDSHPLCRCVDGGYRGIVAGAVVAAAGCVRARVDQQQGLLKESVAYGAGQSGWQRNEQQAEQQAAGRQAQAQRTQGSSSGHSSTQGIAAQGRRYLYRRRRGHGR